MQQLDKQHLEYTAIKTKAKQAALQKLLTEYHTHEIMNNPEQFEEVDPGFTEFLRTKTGKQSEKGGHGKYWLMVTVNPKPDINLSVLRSRVEKFVGRTFAEVAIWTFEQRGTTPEDIHGIHSHIFLRRKSDVAPSRIKHFATKDFSDLVGNEKHIDIRYFTDKDSINGINYVKGIKRDQDKETKINMDILWRQTEGLQAYYEKL